MRMFRSTAILGILAGILLGCGPAEVYYKDATSFASLEQDLLACDVQALKEAPVANEIRQGPPIFYPGRRICKDGSCYHTGGYWREGRIYTVDTNAALRSRIAQSCMLQKNYSLIEAQRCPPGTVRPPKDALRQLLPPGPQNCAISVKGGPVVLRPTPE